MALAAETEHAGRGRRKINTYNAGDLMKGLFALALLLPVMSLAKSPLDGTWMTNVKSVTTTGKPDVYDISNGMYSCSSCVPAYKIKADGSDQPVPGHDYLDHEAVKVVNATTVEFTDKKAGKVMQTVSADGKSITMVDNDMIHGSKTTSMLDKQP